MFNLQNLPHTTQILISWTAHENHSMPKKSLPKVESPGPFLPCQEGRYPPCAPGCMETTVALECRAGFSGNVLLSSAIHIHRHLCLCFCCGSSLAQSQQMPEKPLVQTAESHGVVQVIALYCTGLLQSMFQF